MSESRKTVRVLVVDDNSDYANTLAMLLVKSGYESYVCVHAKDCMAQVESLRPEVILLDLAMPGMTGFDIADEILCNPDLRPVRLVAVTGSNDEEDREQTRTHGFDYHLIKPVDFKYLQTILSTVSGPGASG